MMMVWLLALLFAAMTLVAVALVVRPLLRNRSIATGASSRAVNVAVYRDRLAELEADLAAGTLSQERFDEARAELDREVLDDTAGAADELSARASRSPFAAVLNGLVVTVLAAGLYFWLGSPALITPPASAPEMPDNPRAFVAENLEALENQIEADPDNAEAWEMLGTAYLVLERGEDAAAAFAEAIRVGGEQPTLLVQQARALAVAGNGRFGDDARRHLQRALELAPDDPRTLWLTGLAAAQHDEPERARVLWNRLLAQAAPDSEVAGMLRQAIGNLSASGAASTPNGATPPGDSTSVATAATAEAAVDVQVTLPGELRQGIRPDTTVFVLARAFEGPPLPLAVQRLTVAELPATIRLDDSMAMRPGFSLSDFDRVEIVARVSRSGGARPEPGDIEGSAGPVTIGDQSGPVQVEINRRL